MQVKETRQDIRQTRDSGTREANTRSMKWKRGSRLPDPNPHPDWEYHWVMTSVMGEAVPSHTNGMLADAWEPVKAEEVPEVTAKLLRNMSKDGGVETGGLLLCRMPKEMYNDMIDQFEAQANRDFDSIRKRNQTELGAPDSRGKWAPTEVGVRYSRGGSDA